LIRFAANRGDQWGEVVNQATWKHTSHPTSKYGTPYTSSMPLLPAAAMAPITTGILTHLVGV
jgi:hypothetical protein